MVFQQIGGINGVGFYASQTFVAAGMSSGNMGTIAYALIQVPITVVGALLMDRSGRRPLLMVSTQLYLFMCRLHQDWLMTLFGRLVVSALVIRYKLDLVEHEVTTGVSRLRM